MSKYITLSIAIVTFITGIGLGYIITPQYALMNNEDNAVMQDLGKADKYVDLRYLEAMIVHHRGAIQLAEQVKDLTQRNEIKELAEMILRGEPKAIDELYAWRKDWYGLTSTVKDQKVPNLGTNDGNLDLRLLNALIAHHEDGLMMTKEIRLKSTRNEILNNADATEAFFTNTKKTFEKWRYDWYKVGMPVE
jgi:uncharacterized protein (DUF305 family)